MISRTFKDIRDQEDQDLEILNGTEKVDGERNIQKGAIENKLNFLWKIQNSFLFIGHSMAFIVCTHFVYIFSPELTLYTNICTFISFM